MSVTTKSTLLLLRIFVEHQQDDLPAATGEATEHQVTVQGDLGQALDNGEVAAETDGLRDLHQTSSADVQSQIQGDSENGPRPLQGQVNRQQASQLVSLGQGGHTLVDEPRRQGLQHVSEEYSSMAVLQDAHGRNGYRHWLRV